MKLCRKCIDAIFASVNQNGLVIVIDDSAQALELIGQPSIESDCEFWAHKALRNAMILAAGYKP